MQECQLVGSLGAFLEGLFMVGFRSQPEVQNGTEV